MIIHHTQEKPADALHLFTLHAPADEADLALLHNYRRVALVETGVDDGAGQLAQLDSKNNQTLYLTLSTYTAFHLPLSYFLSRRLQMLAEIDEKRRVSIELCLQEAISNALIHGNLGLASAAKDEMNIYLSAVQERLAADPWKNRTIKIAIFHLSNAALITIEDEGDGFTAAENKDGLQATQMQSGRGLGIIRELATRLEYDKGGRRANIEIDLSAPEKSSISASLATLTDKRIMVVDDTDYNAQLIVMMLQKAGWKNIDVCRDGAEALKNYHKKKPDLILLDLSMPVMDGFTVCKKIREELRDARTPIIVLTGHVGVSERTKAFAAGATDFVCKPIYQAELVARIKIQLENQQLIADLQGFHDRLAQDLRMARAMQNELLPTAPVLAEIHKNPHMRIASYFKPSDELAGDTWGIEKLDDEKLALFITDFSGHGVTAAINAFRLHAMLYVEEGLKRDPAKMLEHLNALLQRSLALGQFAAMSYLVADLEARLLYYASSAMPPAMLYQGHTQKVALLDETDFPLGIRAKIELKNKILAFPEGSILCLYSDALIETEDAAGKYLAVEDVQNWLQNCPKDLTTQGMVDHLVDHLFGFERLQRVTDDLSIVIFQYAR